MLKVLKAGFFTTIQDKGRFGHRHKGVPVAGVMDNLALERANGLLENKEDAAVLEITMTGPTVEFTVNTYIALTGATMSVTLNNVPITKYKVYKINKGDIVSYGRLENGIRSYLAVKGGFKSAVVLNSRSLSRSITKITSLEDGSEVPYDECLSFKPKISELKVKSYSEAFELEVTKGPEYEILTDRQLEQLFGEKFTVSKENNRMAYQLNEKIDKHNTSMLTSATLPGTVQFTPAGRLIILMKDGQTTGGYPRILQLTDKAIAILAQKKAGDTIVLKLLLKYM